MLSTIIAIVVLLGFIGYDLYDKYYVEKENKRAISQFEEMQRENEEEKEE